MFTLNEAPNMVLAKISATKTARNCGAFFSILCFIPTCGATMGIVRDCREWNLYPKNVSLESGAGLQALIDALNKIRVNPSEVMSESDKRSLIEWQVKQTINLLEQVCNEDVIKDDFADALTNAFTQIQTRAYQEEKFSTTLEKNKFPLTEELYLPKYGLVMNRD